MTRPARDIHKIMAGILDEAGGRRLGSVIAGVLTTNPAREVYGPCGRRRP